MDDDPPRGLPALGALNFFMADVQAGIGPFLGVFLQGHGWTSGPIGSVMTIGGVAGVAVSAPAGALIDATRLKRLAIVVAGLCTVLASGLVWLSQDFWVVAASQVATAVAGSVIGPAITGLTLGLVRQRGFARQNGTNQVWNHAGNMVGAALSGWLGWRFGLVAVFWLSAAFGLLSILSVLLIPARAIDHRAARGLDDDDGDDGAGPSGLHTLFADQPLLLLAAALAMFHLGNAAMLPMYGLAVVGAKQGDPAAFTAKTIVVAQAVMIVAALLARRLAATRGYWPVILVAFLALPVRGVVAAVAITAWGVYPVQALDGVGAGLLSVAVPGLVACLLDGTGRVNVGQGAVMAVQGLGAALSPAIGGWLAQLLGYSAAFLILGAFALGSVGIWLGFGATLRQACAVGERR